jgi:hypothetical protein
MTRMVFASTPAGTLGVAPVCKRLLHSAESGFLIRLDPIRPVRIPWAIASTVQVAALRIGRTPIDRPMST